MQRKWKKIIVWNDDALLGEGNRKARPKHWQG